MSPRSLKGDPSEEPGSGSKKNSKRNNALLSWGPGKGEAESQLYHKISPSPGDAVQWPWSKHPKPQYHQSKQRMWGKGLQRKPHHFFLCFFLPIWPHGWPHHAMQVTKLLTETCLYSQRMKKRGPWDSESVREILESRKIDKGIPNSFHRLTHD